MKNETNFLNLFLVLVFIVLLFYILKVGADLIIPFIIALLFSFAIIGLSDFYKNIGIGKYKIPAFFAMILSLGTYVFIFWLLGKMINTNIQDVIKLLPIYQERVSSLYMSLLHYFNIPSSVDAYSLFQKIDISSLFTSLISSITGIFSKAGIILFYVLFILLEYRFFGEKIQLMFQDGNKRENAFQTLEKIKSDVKSYFLIKAMVSVVTGFLSYLVMIIFGLDFALFWAMSICLLNFIPNVGSVIAVSLPVILSLIQYDSLYPFLFIFSGLIGIQILMSNIIEPRFMGNKLNLSPLVIVISLGFWGIMWGIVGMLLSVPLMVIMNIIFSKFEATRPVAILLSEKGELDVHASRDVSQNKKELLDNVKKRLEIIKNIKN
ncbi:MAG: AI-2E family transporter [Candidatus Altimarinota bacterium]